MQRVLTVTCMLLVLGGAVQGGYGSEKQLSKNTRAQMLKVERSNQYCNFQRPFGPVCNMTGFDGILTIQPDAMLTNALEIAIIGADTILLYPTCVPWVKFYGAQDFFTPLRNRKSGEGRSAGEENRSCRTWLRAFDSKISTLQSGIHDISLENSTVQIINLQDLRDVKIKASNISSIEHLDWKGYKGEILFAKIDNILNLECNDNLTTFGTHIGHIKYNGFSFNAKKLILNYTTIDEVYFQGILLNSGDIFIENTILKKVNREGIVLGPEAKLLMKNVTIEECQNPCFVLPFRRGNRYFRATNVTVNGKPIEDDPSIIRVTLDEIVETPHSLENDPQCNTSAETLLCDFRDYNETVVLTPTDDSTITRMNISNSANLHIVEACEMDIVVKNTMGVYTEAVRGSRICEGTGGTLTSINSTFSVFHVEDLKQLTALHSNINGIHANTVNELVSHNSALKIRQITVSDKTYLFDSEVDIVNATIDGTFHANATKFSDVSALHIVGNASIVNSDFDHLGIHSITVSGHLFMTQIKIKNYDFLSIYLTESGKIELDEIQMDARYHFISAVRYDQVIWNSRDLDDVRTHLIALRRAEDEDDDSAVADDGQRNCTSIQSFSSSLFVSARYDIFCNYSGVEEAGVISRMNDTERQWYDEGGSAVHEKCSLFQYEDVQTVSVSLVPSIIGKSLVIEGARNVRMKEICSHEITLMNVANATMDYLAYHCFYRLRMQNSRVMNIVNEPTILKIENSTVEEIETPFPMSSLGIHNSSIGSLLASPETTSIQYSNIASIKVLMSHQYFVVNHSTIEVIKSMYALGSGALINMNIGKINYPGILIEGHLLIENVTIDFLDMRSFVFVGEGSVTMKNVDISKGWINSFNVSGGSISFTNVTMLGSPLVNGIHVDLPPTQPPANKVTPSTVKVNTVPAPVPTTIPPEEPVEHLTSKVKAATDAPGSPTSSNGQQTQPWVKWATAGASIFLALVVVLAGLSMAVAIRTYRSGETFSSRLGRMFRAANDDELQLSTELDIHVASDSTNTHYSRLPSV